ncbi:MAG: SGNH/GDSL hydrolase family protein, partial [Candidatus Latescibacterota bacterium]
MAGLLVGLLLGEAVLRLAAPQVHRRPPVWEFDPLLGWRHVPGASGVLRTPEFEVTLTINPDGLRDTLRARQPQSGTLRILAFGDSFVEGWGVPLETSAGHKLEAHLRPLLAGRSVEVLNFGVAGYGTDQELLYFEREGRVWGAQWVVVFFYANDLWNNAASQGIGTERGFKPHFQRLGGGELALRGVPVPRIPAWDPDWQGRLPWHARL